MTRLPMIALLTAMPMLLAGCGAAASSSQTQATTRTVAPGTQPASSAIGSSPSANVPRCLTSQLAFSFSTNGAAGSIHINGDFTNRSKTSCSLYGYPGLGLLDENGAALATSVLRSPSVVVPTVAKKLVILAPKDKARFYAGYSDIDPQPCRTAAKLEVTPPNAYAHLTVPATIAPCGGIIHVSPVFGLSGA